MLDFIVSFEVGNMLDFFAVINQLQKTATNCNIIFLYLNCNDIKKICCNYN